MKPQKENGNVYTSDDLDEILKQFLGYLNKANVSIIDLSGVPFEVLSITISLISRIVFDFCFHFSKLKHERNEVNDVPFMIVCEEAHNYVPRSGSVDYAASRKSIERIAKEGRKYGISLMVVSQRPSVLAALYSNKPPCLIFHRTALASIDVATGYASFSRLADEK